MNCENGGVKLLRLSLKLSLLLFFGVQAASHAHAARVIDTHCEILISEIPSVSKKLPDLTESKRYVEQRQKERNQARLLAEREPIKKELIKRHKLTEAEAVSIEDYSAYDYEELNPMLRQDAKTGTKRGMKSDYARVDLLKQALAKVTPAPTVSFRGANLKQPELEALNLKVGGIIEDAAFVSSDLNPKVAVKFSEITEGWMTAVVFEVHGKTGREITAFSTNTAETEILFLPGTKFQIRSIEQIGRRKFVVLDELDEAGLATLLWNQKI